MARAQRPQIYTAQISVAVTPEMLAGLRNRAELMGGSVADIVRDAIELTAEIAPELRAALKEGAARHGVAVVTLVREALEEYEGTNWGAE